MLSTGIRSRFRSVVKWVFRSWVKRKARKVERTGKKAVKEIERGGKSAVKDVDRIANQSIDEIERAAHVVGGAIEKEIMSIIDDVKDLANKAKRDIEGAANTVKREVEDVANKAKSEIEGVAEDAKKGVYRAGDEIKDTFEKELPALLETCISGLVSEAIKPALKAQAKIARDFADGMDSVAARAPELVDEINNVGFDVELKVNIEINLEYANFWTRAREVAGILDRYGNDGIALRRRDIIGFITAVGPDSISFGGGASLSFGLDIGGVAKAKSLSLALFVELADYVMKEAGVPE